MGSAFIHTSSTGRPHGRCELLNSQSIAATGPALQPITSLVLLSWGSDVWLQVGRVYNNLDVDGPFLQVQRVGGLQHVVTDEHGTATCDVHVGRRLLEATAGRVGAEGIHHVPLTTCLVQ